jgi:hypothetical protein
MAEHDPAAPDFGRPDPFHAQLDIAVRPGQPWSAARDAREGARRHPHLCLHREATSKSTQEVSDVLSHVSKLLLDGLGYLRSSQGVAGGQSANRLDPIQEIGSKTWVNAQ